MIRRRLCELIEQIPELPRYVTLGDDVPPLPTRLEVHEYQVAIYTRIVTWSSNVNFRGPSQKCMPPTYPSHLYLPLGSFKYLHVSLLP